MYCTTCRNKLKLEHQFCSKCGTKLEFSKESTISTNTTNKSFETAKIPIESLPKMFFKQLNKVRIIAGGLLAVALIAIGVQLWIDHKHKTDEGMVTVSSKPFIPEPQPAIKAHEDLMSDPDKAFVLQTFDNMFVSLKDIKGVIDFLGDNYSLDSERWNAALIQRLDDAGKSLRYESTFTVYKNIQTTPTFLDTGLQLLNAREAAAGDIDFAIMAVKNQDIDTLAQELANLTRDMGRMKEALKAIGVVAANHHLGLDDLFNSLN